MQKTLTREGRGRTRQREKRGEGTANTEDTWILEKATGNQLFHVSIKLLIIFV